MQNKKNQDYTKTCKIEFLKLQSLGVSSLPTHKGSCIIILPNYTEQGREMDSNHRIFQELLGVR